MFIVSIKTSRKKTLLCVISVVLGVFLIVSLGFAGHNAGKRRLEENCYQFLTQSGWQVDEKTETTMDVIIPYEFDSTYSAYNKLQKAQGFDLCAYQGEDCRIFTYKVTNYPAGGEAEAAVITYHDDIIGGDVHQLEQGAEVIPIR